MIAPLLVLGCASIPKGQYGVASIEWKGVDAMSSQALEKCLATRARERVSLKLGLGGASCGEPPFDEETPELELWAWPWSEWPVYDPAIFEVEKRRIERWYQARGFYHAHVVDVRYTLDGKPVQAPERCTSEDCALSLAIRVDEGKPVYVNAVEITGASDLDPDLQEDLKTAPTLQVQRRFDEAPYEADKAALLELLKRHAYARASVVGSVQLNREGRWAHVTYAIDHGPRCRFGQMRTEGEGVLSAELVERVAGIRPGAPYDEEVIYDAESAVFALGTFASVRIEPEFRDANSDVVDLVIRVTPGRRDRLRLGVGVMSGTLARSTSDETFSVPQWDLHLKASYKHEDFLGGMRKLRIEDRPRLIFVRDFPKVPSFGPRLGNALSIGFEQPSFIEQRTVFFTDNFWDVGPDAYFGYFRHDLADKIGLRRAFLHQKLKLELALQHDLYEIIDSAAPDSVSSYRLPFAEQSVRLDLRDDSQRTRRGFYFASTVQEALRLGYGSWDYVRWLPEARAYQRLPFRIVLAQRVAFGALFVLAADKGLDPTSRELGAQSYRLRGGGADSNRGFAAGKLGDGIDGGRRRWEASFEARVPLSEDFGFVLFFDAGDVSRSRHVRLSHLNAATGFGFRYFSFFAPIRFDLGWRIPGWQVVGGGAEPQVDVGVLPSAAHLSIGEAF